jgi:hypothetical protein
VSDSFWRDHKFGQGVKCTFTPRESYKGRPMLPELKAHTGNDVELLALWKMTKSDPYPGEWALGAPDHGEVFGRSWIASGDVTVKEKQ